MKKLIVVVDNFDYVMAAFGRFSAVYIFTINIGLPLFQGPIAQTFHTSLSLYYTVKRGHANTDCWTSCL
jgi:hypothetical protein